MRKYGMCLFLLKGVRIPRASVQKPCIYRAFFIACCISCCMFQIFHS
nr:MAG TPA: hypothetical protein [Caudoviricetes sp.]